MEMKEINKIVQLSDLQYEKLLKDRQIEINGEIKIWEPDTLYVTPNNNYQWLFDKFYETAIKPNEVYHTPMNMKSLEQEYEYLTTEDNNLAYVSAIGYTAILKNGDTIKVTEPNKGTFYINGSVVTNDYTYTGDGYEIVNVWVFENNDAPKLNDTPTFNISELDVRNIAQTPVVGDQYKNYAMAIKVYNFEISGLATRKLVSNGTETFNQQKVSSVIEEVESDCVTFSESNTTLINKTNLTKIDFPNLTTIKTKNNTSGFLSGCSSLVCNFPKLKTIGSVNNSWHSPFSSVKEVILPQGLVYIGKYAVCDNKVLILNCNKATFDTNWCYNAPSVNFIMCDDWQASINISVAAKNYTVDWFIDLFTNKLADMTGQDAPQINIPLAIFEALSPEQLAIAQNKNWTVTGL